MRKLDLCCFWRLLLLWLGLISGLSSFGGPIISEFMAANASGLADEDGDFSDWIEIHNPAAVPISLAGYHLTDDAANPGKWTFPAMTLNPGASLVVFASGKNRTDPAGQLHTDFQLSSDGRLTSPQAPARLIANGAQALSVSQAAQQARTQMSPPRRPLFGTGYSGLSAITDSC